MATHSPAYVITRHQRACAASPPARRHGGPRGKASSRSRTLRRRDEGKRAPRPSRCDTDLDGVPCQRGSPLLEALSAAIVAYTGGDPSRHVLLRPDPPHSAHLGLLQLPALALLVVLYKQLGGDRSISNSLSLLLALSHLRRMQAPTLLSRRQRGDAPCTQAGGGCIGYCAILQLPPTLQ